MVLEAMMEHSTGNPPLPVVVRESTTDDVPDITRIYAHWVLHGLASFELESPDRREMGRRRETVLAGDYPYLVALDRADGAVLGYAYANAYRPRPAYRFACEDSIYIAPEAQGRGVGRTLLAALISRCEARNFRLMVAVIGDSGNVASIDLHAGLGFQRAGLLPAIGWKHNRWVDSVLMTRPLGPGASVPPASPPT
jgi:L-amino acid N-acyltransferase YncA